MHPSLSQPPAPGSPEAMFVMQEFKRTQCQYIYGGHGQAFGGQCCERAVYPKDDPKFCADHKRGKQAKKFNDPEREPERWGGIVEPL